VAHIKRRKMFKHLTVKLINNRYKKEKTAMSYDIETFMWKWKSVNRNISEQILYF